VVEEKYPVSLSLSPKKKTAVESSAINALLNMIENRIKAKKIFFEFRLFLKLTNNVLLKKLLDCKFY